MGIQIEFEKGLWRATVYCDYCKRRIDNARFGNVEWKHGGEGHWTDVEYIVFLHKDCSYSFRHQVSDKDFYCQSGWMELGLWIRSLSYGMATVFDNPRIFSGSITDLEKETKKGEHVYVVRSKDTDEVLYVGKTTCGVKSRISQHIYSGDTIGNYIRDYRANVLIDVYETHYDLDNFEKQMIQELGPEFNIAGVKC